MGTMSKAKLTNQIKKLKQSLDDLPLGQIIAEFMNYLKVEAGLSENTVLAYGRDLRNFAGHCIFEGTTTIEQIDLKAVQSFIIILSKTEHKSESTIARNLVAIKMLLRYAVLTDRKIQEFIHILEGPKLWQRLPSVCNKTQVQKLINAPDQETDQYYFRDKAILELLYSTGMRASELADLQVSSINYDIGYIRCFGKGDKERVIPLGQSAITAVMDYIQNLRHKLLGEKDTQQLMISRTGNPLGRIEIWRVVKKYARKADLPAQVTAHTLRHCFATHLLSGGADLRSVQEMLGHIDIATTQIYTHVDQDRLREMHKKFHPKG